jgi:hypothetical protein
MQEKEKERETVGKKYPFWRTEGGIIGYFFIILIVFFCDIQYILLLLTAVMYCRACRLNNLFFLLQ